VRSCASSAGPPSGEEDACSLNAPRGRRWRRRGRPESYQELVGRYVRYAKQIDRLVVRRGKKWRKIHAVRARQRRVLYALLDMPAVLQSKALRRVQPLVRDKCVLKEYETGVDSGQVYVHVHPWVRHNY
jgi:hypothetical protein